MKRPGVLIVAVVAGALLVAGAGASAHTVLLLGGSTSSHGAPLHDEASGARTESPLHAQVTRGDAVVEGRCHLHDRVVLDVQLEHAPHPAVRTHSLRDRLP